MYTKTIGKSKTSNRVVAPTWNTVVIFDGGEPRRTPHFGRGILAYTPHVGRKPFTSRDAEIAMQIFGDLDEETLSDSTLWDEESALEQRFLESAMLDRYIRGHLPL